MTEQKTLTGRPSLYKSEYCDQIVDYCKNGASFVEFAAFIGVSKQTLLNWREEHQDFFDAYMRAGTLAQAWFEKAARENLSSKEFNGNLWAKYMGARFRDEYGDKIGLEHTGKDGGAIKTVNVIELVAGVVGEARQLDAGDT